MRTSSLGKLESKLKHWQKQTNYDFGILGV